MGATWRVRRSSGRRHAAAVCLVLLLGGAVLSSGGLDDILDQDQNQDRLDAIGAVYRQGEKARQALEDSGITLPTEPTCEDAFHRTGADTERSSVTRRTGDNKEDTAFAELRKLSFINGILGRPNNLPATPLPSTPAASTSAN
ncbi:MULTISPECIES: hypothetical protein [unclassified Micromonospora]|uniref:hypothetical protein n=1 Tax=unclassified Micromonospora TaxID=2617518 RepID=UPI0033AE7344